MSKTNQINITVTLGEDQIPESISWEASGQEEQAKAMLLSFFDEKTKETLKIDLWTRDMEVREMDQFFFTTLNAMTDTYVKATGNAQLAGAMKSFAEYFGVSTGLIEPKDEQ